MSKAKTLVFKLVRAGKIKNPKKMFCVDCGINAECYDHRDYLKPLDVQPVCRSCNTKRGPGLNKC